TRASPATFQHTREKWDCGGYSLPSPRSALPNEFSDQSIGARLFGFDKHLPHSRHLMNDRESGPALSLVPLGGLFLRSHDNGSAKRTTHRLLLQSCCRLKARLARMPSFATD